MTIKLLYPIISTGLLILWFYYPSIIRLFKKPKKKQIGNSTADLIVDSVGGAIQGLADIATGFFMIIIYLITWIIWFIIF